MNTSTHIPQNSHDAPLVLFSFFQVRFSSNLPPTHQSRYGDLAEEDKPSASPENRALMQGSTSNMRRRQVHKLMSQQGTGKEGWSRRASNISSDGDTSSGPDSLPPRRHSEPQMYSAIGYLRIRFVNLPNTLLGCEIKWLLKRYLSQSFQVLSTIVVSPSTASSVLLVNITVCTTAYIGVHTFK